MVSDLWKLRSDCWGGRMPDYTRDTLPSVSRLRPKANSQLRVQRTLQQLPAGETREFTGGNLTQSTFQT